MISGADPVDETIFVPEPTPGVYKATGLEKLVMNAVEMDGPQYRYPKAFDTTEHIKEGMPQREVVNEKPATIYHDREAELVYIHTSDGRPPAAHEIELIRRNYGIVTYGKQYVRVIGFTFRHMGTAGLNFEDGSHHCIAIDNKSYGAWQGIRVFSSNDVVVADNELFRNSNSGIYISLGSSRGYAIGNILYENSKGVRWSSDSVNGLALDNVAFANRETGIAIEHSDGIRVIRNALVDNGISHLMVRKSRYMSEANCFEPNREEGFIPDLGPFERFETLAE
jgi:parallel beta-helix repeat protein